MVKENILLMNGIHKSFPGVKALNDVNLELNKGDILALLGENGAGKSTLIKILSGAYEADKGEIIFDGEKVNIVDPRDAIEIGISVIYQELNNADPLTIAENIFMGQLKLSKRTGLVDYKGLRKQTQELLDRVGLSSHDPFDLVGSLSIAEKQMVEIAKALARNAKILVMDEPTATLNNEEIEILFRLIKQIAAQGTAVIYISHRLDEVFEITNKVMVLRDGCNVKTLETSNTCKSELIKLMVGREIKDMYPVRTQDHLGDIILEIDNLSSNYVKDISFNVRSGEIVGLFGLMGSGRTEIVETLIGDKKINNGTIKRNGEVVRIDSPKDAKALGIGYIPSDRKDSGLFLVHSVVRNICINIIELLLNKFGLLKASSEKDVADKWIKHLKIKTPSNQTLVDSLSGGNQQKIVVAKWLAASPIILIMNEPTRGIDVGAKAEIYNLMSNLSKQGIAFIVISPELPELMAMSDRIVVIHEGMLKGELTKTEFSQEKLLATALG